MDEEALSHNYIPSCPLGVAGRRDKKSPELDKRENCGSPGLGAQTGRSGW